MTAKDARDPTGTFEQPHPPMSSEAEALVAPEMPANRRVVFAAVAINAIEFYDFMVYAFFAVYIGKAFFPASTPVGSLLLSVAVFGVGFITRPLGSVLIGVFADHAGRKAAMLLSALLMTIGTLGLALTPDYERIGIAAPIVAVLCRLVQGFALGGEVGPSTAFLIEIAPPGRLGLFASWQLASQGIAGCIAGLVGACLSLTLSPEALQDWGWRVPFVLGLAVLPVALYLRATMPETLPPARASGEPAGMAGLRHQRRLLTLSVLVVLGATVSTYVGIFMTSYAITSLGLPAPVALIAALATGLSTLVFSLLGGWLSDRIGRRAVMFWPRLALVVLTVPAFAVLVHHPSALTLWLVSAGLAALTSASGAASFAAIGELLPRRVRATGAAITYAVGVSLFGGTTQLIVTWLVEVTGNAIAPAWYVAVASTIAALAVLALPRVRSRA